jgi:Bacterial Ig-like domain (group 3)
VGDDVTAPPYSFRWDTSTVTAGQHTVGAIARDADGNGARASVNVTMQSDTAPPQLSVSTQPRSLWPPNGNMVPVTVAVSVSDDQDPRPAVSLVSITCDDACNPAEDISGAGLGTDDRQFELRARRQGAGSGRTYRIEYAARDAAGNVASASVTVVVPHDSGN